MTDIYEFIQKLRLSHFIDSKQLRFIQRIGFYINDLVVYFEVYRHIILKLELNSLYS